MTTTRYCLQCDDGTALVHDRRDVCVQIKGRTRTVSAIGGWFCPRCEEIEFDPGEGQRYNEAMDVLSTEIQREDAEMLRRVRLKLGLTQAEAAALTGGGHNAFSRYERGEARPLQAVINLFRLLDRDPALLEVFSDRGQDQYPIQRLLQSSVGMKVISVAERPSTTVVPFRLPQRESTPLYSDVPSARAN